MTIEVLIKHNTLGHPKKVEVSEYFIRQDGTVSEDKLISTLEAGGEVAVTIWDTKGLRIKEV